MGPKNNDTLAGGFKYFLFSPLFGEDFHFDLYCSKGLVQPPTSIVEEILVAQLLG